MSQEKADEIVEGFFGCYLLVSRSEQPRICGQTYIGFTVDPNRRIGQHNAGAKAGGARRTSKRGPWDMIVMVHGFPNQISALRFEWAWQHPTGSRRLKNFNLKKRNKEKQLDFRVRILAYMLRSGPWNRLALTVRWLKDEYRMEFPEDLQPPSNVRISCGPVIAVKRAFDNQITDDETVCRLCATSIAKLDKVFCPRQNCHGQFHLLCLARKFLGNEDQLLPVDGRCPKCQTKITWADVVKMRQTFLKASSIEDILLFCSTQS